MTMRVGVRDLKIWQHHRMPPPTAHEFSVLTGGMGVRGFMLLCGLSMKGLIPTRQVRRIRSNKEFENL